MTNRVLKQRSKEKAFVNFHAAYEQKDRDPAVNLARDRLRRTGSAKDKAGEANESCPERGTHNHFQEAFG